MFTTRTTGRGPTLSDADYRTRSWPRLGAGHRAGIQNPRERAEAALAEKGAHADATVNPLTGERNMLIHPYSQEERAAMAAVDGASDASGEEMEEGDEEEEAPEEAEEEAGGEEGKDVEESEAEGEADDGGEGGEAEGEAADGVGCEAEGDADGGEGGETGGGEAAGEADGGDCGGRAGDAVGGEDELRKGWIGAPQSTGAEQGQPSARQSTGFVCEAGGDRVAPQPRTSCTSAAHRFTPGTSS